MKSEFIRLYMLSGHDIYLLGILSINQMIALFFCIDTVPYYSIIELSIFLVGEQS